MIKVLIVDDDPSLIKVLKIGLTAKGYDTRSALRGTEALTLAIEEPPDVMVVDLGLPDLDGLAVLREVRRLFPVKILVLSAFGDEATKVRVLDGGADDYVTKPFSMSELEARIRALLRRVPDEPEISRTVIESGSLRLDLIHRQARESAGGDLRLTKREFELLYYLVSNAGQLCTYQMILEAVWGPGYLENHYVRIYVNRLRSKLGPRAVNLENRSGIGYVWVGESN